MTLPVSIGHCAVYSDPAAYSAAAPASVTLGRFDGVHMGHRGLLEATVADARAAAHRQALAITFWPPPEWVLRPEAPRRLLITLADRLELMAATGLDAVIVWPFDRASAALSPEQFLRRLYDQIHMRSLITGPDARLGKDRAGTPQVIAAVAGRLGVSYREIPWQGTPAVMTSGRLRAALETGALAQINAALGRSHSIAGRVVAGDGRGRSIGFPTANLELPDWLLLPANGIYAGLAAWDGGDAPSLPIRAAINVGVRPTFGPGERLIEVHLLDFAGELYGRTLRVFLHARLRDEQSFGSVEELVGQIRRDLELARKIPAPEPASLEPFAPSAGAR